MFSWACALALLGLSAPTSCTAKFYYSTGAYRRSDECNLCFEKDCMTLDQARCDYYAEADEVLKDDDEDPGGEEDPAMRKEVDDLVFDLVDKVSGLSNNMDCIPYVSRYTNCNKENVCLGCKSCACDPEGRWNCSIMQLCRSHDQPLNIDHRVLVIVMEALIDSQSHKVKRSVTDNPDDATSSTITLEELSEWFYGVKPLSKLEVSTDTPSRDLKVAATDNGKAILTTTERVSTTRTSEATTMITNAKSTGDTDYVAFDEVLRSIAVDTKTYNRRKPLDNKFNNQSFDVDYMIMDDDNATGSIVGDDLAYVVNFMQEDDAEIITESTVGGSTKVVIDLLETAGKVNSGNVTDDDIGINKDLDLNIFENTNDIIEYNAANIMKRDVSVQDNLTSPLVAPTITIIVNTTNTSKADHNKSEDRIDLNADILVPLDKIIKDKINELENLKRIRESLLRILNSDGDPPEDTEKESNVSETHFSIYNIALESGLNVDLRRASPNMLEKYMTKLKRDIFEVLRDITLIANHRQSVPDDLKYLLYAMKQYVYKNKLLDKMKPGKKSKRLKSFRRQMQQSYGRCDFISFKDCLVQVIEVIDKTMPKTDALSPLSPASRKIMKHVILSHYVDENAVPGLRVHDPHYNLTNDLRNIGSQWQGMTNSLLSSSPFATLYRMKLLHYVLTSDISKMNDALGLIDFAHSRRMLHTLDNVSDNILEKINNGLTAIHNKIQIIIRYYAKKPATTFTARAKDDLEDRAAVKPVAVPSDNRKNTNRSFIKHIRTLLKTSKKDIAELLHKKVPKSEIVKQLAKKKLDEISEKRYREYEETMRRWQKNLEMAPRFKRSVIDTFKTRIKSIIPNYLRHKVNPRINESKKNATETAFRKADERKKKRKASKRERKSRRSTTPLPKAATPKSFAVTSKPSAASSKASTVKKHMPAAKH